MLVFIGLAVAQETCFQPLPQPTQPLAKPPFDEAAIATMRARFLANINFNTGAVVASPSVVPAQVALGGDAVGYSYEWVRDSALSMLALMRLANSSIGLTGQQGQLTQDMVDVVVPKYMSRVAAILARGNEMDVQGEPRWGLDDVAAIVDTWCRPQTDGPGLRALLLIGYARRPQSPADQKQWAWLLASQHLDWLAKEHNLNTPSCDLWEEDMHDGSLLWNHIVSARALDEGHRLAASIGEWDRAKQYHRALKSIRTVSGHLKKGSSGAYVTECAPQGGTKCTDRGGDVDGAVILSFIHGGWLDCAPTSQWVANTVRVFNEKFCELYPVNRQDTEQALPGILYGRYAKDEYGGGNPWVLITAALANLFYQAASAAAHEPPRGAALEAWQAALFPSFQGHAAEFVAAGDAVLKRLEYHVISDNFQLFEQIDKVTGRQYNAADLTWSYAEVLSALASRVEALAAIAGEVWV